MNKQVSGFTFIKNGLTLGYPVLESIRSIEPLCDEVVINVGYDDPDLTQGDGTYEYLRDNLPEKKFVFLQSYWDPNLTSQGLVLSQQTNIALEKCTGKYCQYIQGDEALHESDYPAIEAGVKEMEKNSQIEGLVYKYLHFYGNVDALLYTRKIYRREVRMIRNHLGIKSHLDAQGFKHADGSKLKAKLIDATVHHYGWARKEQVMAKKVEAMDKLYHGKEHQQKEEFIYRKIWGIRPFKGTHPKVMQEWIKTHRNEIDIHSLPLDWKWNNVGLAISDFIERMTGYRMGEYKNYKLIK